MKQSEFVRWLIRQGVRIEDGTKHLKLYYQDKYTTLVRHPSQELGKKTVQNTKKALGLDK